MAKEFDNAIKISHKQDVTQAIETFNQWLTLYQQNDFVAQHKLVHPLIKKYKDRKSWKKTMRQSLNKNGKLQKLELVGAGVTESHKIPCTEMGHCYRKGMHVVMIVVNSEYEKIGKVAKEYVVMTKTDKGWRFGGGTILNRPYGETLGILDRRDEKRYKYQGIEQN